MESISEIVREWRFTCLSLEIEDCIVCPTHDSLPMCELLEKQCAMFCFFGLSIGFVRKPWRLRTLHEDVVFESSIYIS